MTSHQTREACIMFIKCCRLTKQCLHNSYNIYLGWRWPNDYHFDCMMRKSCSQHQQVITWAEHDGVFFGQVRWYWTVLFMNVRELKLWTFSSSKYSCTVHEFYWTANETFMKNHEFMNLICSWTLTLFRNSGCSWTAMNRCGSVRQTPGCTYSRNALPS